MVKAKLIRLRKVPGTENVADALTKALDGVTLEKHVDLVMGRSRELLMERQVPEDKPGLAIIPKHVEMNAGLRQPMRCFLKTMGWGHDADFDPTPFAKQLMVAAAA